MAGKNSVFSILIDRIRIEKKRHGTLTAAKLAKLVFSRKGRRQFSAYWVKASGYLMRFILRIPPKSDRDYTAWIGMHALSLEQKNDMQKQSALFEYKPVFSVLLPVYDPPEEFLHECIQSVIHQSYPYWELCISDDCSKNPAIRNILQFYANADPRIKLHFRTVNGHISENSNSAMEIATGDFAALLDHDDLLASQALYRCAELLQKEKSADVIYSDEDKINEKGKRMMPFFKPDWSPDSFLCRNYVCHFTVIRMSLMRSIGGFRKGFEGSQDHDLLIRAVEQTKKVFHIPEILYHWRLHSSSTAMNHEVKPYATLAGIKSVEESLKRTNKEATVQPIKNLPGCYRVSYSLKTPEDITVVIHLERGEHPNLRAIDQLIQSGRRAIKEIHFVSGFPLHNEIHHVLNPISVKHNVRITIRINERGTTAAINDAVHTSSGSSILLLANGFVPEHEDALHNLVSYAQHVGVVSSRIISADDYIVCAGIRITGEGKVVRIFSGAVSGHPGYFNSLRCVNNQSLFSMDYLLVRKLVFEHVGGLDETLSGDLASADFCMKVLGLGYQNVYIPDAAFVLPVRYSKLKFRLPEQDETERFVSKWKHITENDPSFNPNLNPENSGYDLNLC